MRPPLAKRSGDPLLKDKKAVVITEKKLSRV